MVCFGIGETYGGQVCGGREVEGELERWARPQPMFLLFLVNGLVKFFIRKKRQTAQKRTL